MKIKGKVTGRDLEIVRLLGRHRLATAEQVMRRFGLQRSKAYERLGVVVSAGLARQEDGVRSARVYLATRAGLNTCDLDPPPATVSAASFDHDMRVLDVAIVLESDPTLRVLTEREIRRFDHRANGGDTYRIGMFAARTIGRGFWPDLVAERTKTGSRFAIEVELSIKAAARLEDKLRSYRNTDYRSVPYLAGMNHVRASSISNVDVRSLDDVLEGDIEPSANRRESGG